MKRLNVILLNAGLILGGIVTVFPFVWMVLSASTTTLWRRARCCWPPSNTAPAGSRKVLAVGLSTASRSTTAPPGTSPMVAPRGIEARTGRLGSGASVQTGKTVSGPTWVGEPRWMVGVVIIGFSDPNGFADRSTRRC